MDAIMKAVNDPKTSDWLRVALTTATGRNAADAVNDADELAELLHGKLKVD